MVSFNLLLLLLAALSAVLGFSGVGAGYTLVAKTCFAFFLLLFIISAYVDAKRSRAAG